MGNVIQFPIKKKDPETTQYEARLKRIREQLQQINELMKRLKDERSKDTWD